MLPIETISPLLQTIISFLAAASAGFAGGVVFYCLVRGKEKQNSNNYQQAIIKAVQPALNDCVKGIENINKKIIETSMINYAACILMDAAKKNGLNLSMIWP